MEDGSGDGSGRHPWRTPTPPQPCAAQIERVKNKKK
uniref:Uncharacterized protein n=1 Tax=Arundo donax TaxID=35708 RepID=A0A0A9APG2_ARUDO